MYDIVYEWFKTNVWDATSLSSMTWEIGGANLDLSQWLSHTSSIIVLAFLSVFLFLCVRWVFRVFADIFTRVGR